MSKSIGAISVQFTFSHIVRLYLLCEIRIARCLGIGYLTIGAAFLPFSEVMDSRETSAAADDWSINREHGVFHAGLRPTVSSSSAAVGAHGKVDDVRSVVHHVA